MLTHVLGQNILNHRIKRPQNLLMPNQNMRLTPQRMKHPRQLHRDIPRPHHRHPLWLLLDLKEPVRVDPVRSTGDVVLRRDGRASADGDDDFFGGDGVGGAVVFGDFDFVFGDEGAPALVVVDLVVDEVLLATIESNPFISLSPVYSNPTIHPIPHLPATSILNFWHSLNPIQPPNISIPLPLQIPPIKLGKTPLLVDSLEVGAEPVGAGFAKVVGDVGGVPHDLFGDATCRSERRM